MSNVSQTTERPRRFAAEDHVEVTGRGRVWTGRSPFEWKRDTGLHTWQGFWSIDHPDADPTKIYRVIGVESHCIQIIRRGAPVGLLFQECGGMNDKSQTTKPTH